MTECRYRVGQRVEVLATDFETPGFPERWTPAQIVAVESIGDAGRWDVQVHADRGTYHPQIVGRRGGNRRLRAA